MPLREFRYVPPVEDDVHELPHLAADLDDCVASPVHGMHADLSAFANQPQQPDPGLYPGWVRLAFPLVASGGLWLAGFWLAGSLR